MSFDNKFTQSEQFYEELIKKFFHTKSYFYYCLQNYLNNGSSLKRQLDYSTSEIISKLIEFLVKVKDPIHEIKEISNAKKFTNFYEEIKTELSQSNLENLDNSQTKNVIQNLAAKTLAGWIGILSNEDNRSILQSYLDLKEKLEFLLDNSNGNGLNMNKSAISGIESNVDLNGEKADMIDQTSILAEEVITGQQEENIAFQKFFEKEIRLILKPISETESEQSYKGDFLKKCYNVFFNLAEVGRFHNNPELVIISEKILQLINVVKQKEQPTIEPVVQLIFAGNRAIEKFVFSHHSPQELDKFLKRFDDYLLKLGVNEHKAEINIDEQKQSAQNAEAADLKKTEREIKNSNIFSTKLQTNALALPTEQETAFSDENLKKDILQFTLPGEDDEDLMSLIQEISSSMAVSSLKDEQNVISDGSNSVQVESSKLSTGLISYQTFYKEAQRFFHVILNAISNINEKIDEDFHLEDIEFASCSLKNLAKRCKFEKIAFLPELIESICVNAKAAEIKLPQSILGKIEEGVRLLKEFDPDNKNHESKLISILSSLKKYYTYTITAAEETALAL